MRTKLILLLVCLTNCTMMAQQINIAVSAVKNYDPYFDTNAKQIYRVLIDLISNDNRYSLLERKLYDEILKEKERQKNEGFIDGVIVEQGKQLGATMFLNVEFDRVTRALQLRMLDLEKGETICSRTYSMNQYMSSDYKLEAPFYKRLRQEMTECLGELKTTARMEFVELLEEKNGKPVKILFYCEAGCNVRRKDKLVVYQILDKKVGGKTVSYEEVVGQATVLEVENTTFFNAKISKGEEEIASIIEGKKMLYAKF